MSETTPPPPPPNPNPAPTSPPAAKSRKWWLIGGLGCLGCGGALAALAFFGVLGALLLGGDDKEEGGGVATRTFVNTPEGLSGDLAENFVPFSFEYPADWKVVETGRDADAANFVKVEKQVEDGFTAENFAVGYISSLPAEAEANPEVLVPLMDALREQFAQNFPNFQPVAQGPAVLGGRQGRYFTFSSRVEDTPRGAVDLWGRVFLIPVGGGRGVAVVMLGTPVGTELRGPAELGQKGELPVIINSFRFVEVEQAAAAPAAEPAAEPAPAASSAAAAEYQVGDAVMIFWQEQWWPGKILEVQDGRYKIRYDNYAESWDEWVTAERLKRPA